MEILPLLVIFMIVLLEMGERESPESKASGSKFPENNIP